MKASQHNRITLLHSVSLWIKTRSQKEAFPYHHVHSHTNLCLCRHNTGFLVFITIFWFHFSLNLRYILRIASYTHLKQSSSHPQPFIANLSLELLSKRRLIFPPGNTGHPAAPRHISHVKTVQQIVTHGAGKQTAAERSWQTWV